MDLSRRRHRSGASPGRAGGGPRNPRGPRSAPSSARPTASRPAPRRRTTGSAAGRGTGQDGLPAGRVRRAPGGLTGRAAVLALVVCALVLSMAYPLKEYLGQRGDIARLERERLASEQRVTLLEERRRQLSDPAYVKAQARKRLQYVKPGETVYVVVAPSTTAPSEPTTTAVPPVDRDGAWYERLWGTVQAADGAGQP